ncbi:MAG: metalloprotease [Marmoricola sp.]|nr:metalloprotease [Marmoricola sp.]
MKLRTAHGVGRLGIGLASLAVLVVPMVTATPSEAVAVRSTAPVACTTGGPVPAGRYQHGDATVSPAVKARVQAQLNGELTSVAARSGGRGPSARTAAAGVTALPAEIHVPVRIHVIHGTHRHDRNISRAMARRAFSTLRAGFAGKQDPTMTPTGIDFELVKVDVHRNDRWFHAGPGSHAAQQMKRRLHRGTARVLNIYLSNARSEGGALLGYARFPWLARDYIHLDGITINVETLPGGTAHGYALGDTVIHETGHWLGLFHTFEGGCDGSGDYIADTAPEAEPSFQCQRTRDTCPTPLPDGWVTGDPVPAAVPDPVTNFMDYSYDSCMNHFTPDQRTRMVTSWLRYRAGH